MLMENSQISERTDCVSTILYINLFDVCFRDLVALLALLALLDLVALG